MDEHTAKYTACIDKAGRTMVERVVPDGGFEYKVRETPVGGQLLEEDARCLLPHAPLLNFCPAHTHTLPRTPISGARSPRRGVLVAVAARKTRRTGGLQGPSDGSGEPARARSLAWDMIVVDPCNGFQPG